MSLTPTNAEFSKHTSNLKVLRRRDPSIVSIIHQFSHVCVYHHDGARWEKHGFEGTMFLFERNAYPPYGIYILNRVGMDDYVQLLYPEDSVQAHGKYLMMRQYPLYTEARLSKIPPNLDRFSWSYALTENLSDESKGPGETVSLWCFDDGGERPMIDTLLKIHSFVKANQRYSRDNSLEQLNEPKTTHQKRQPGLSTSLSPSIDALFAKLPQSSQAQSVNNTAIISAPSSTQSQIPLSLASLFASVSKPPAVSPAANCVPLPPVLAVTGKNSLKHLDNNQASKHLVVDDHLIPTSAPHLLPELPSPPQSTTTPTLGFSLENINLDPNRDKSPSSRQKRDRARHGKTPSREFTAETSEGNNSVVPKFASTHSIWNGITPSTVVSHDGGEEIVELDFSQIAALSNLGTSAEKKTKRKERIARQVLRPTAIQTKVESLSPRPSPATASFLPTEMNSKRQIPLERAPLSNSPTRMIPPQVRSSASTIPRESKYIPASPNSQRFGQHDIAKSQLSTAKHQPLQLDKTNIDSLRQANERTNDDGLKLLAGLLPRLGQGHNLPYDREKFGVVMKNLLQDETFVDQLWKMYWK